MNDDPKNEGITWEWASRVPPGLDKARVFFIDENCAPTTRDKAKNLIIHGYKDGKIVLYTDPPRKKHGMLAQLPTK